MIIEGDDDGKVDWRTVSVLHPNTCPVNVFCTTAPISPKLMTTAVDVHHCCAVQLEIDHNGYMALGVDEHGESLGAGMYAVEIEFHNTGGWEFPSEVDSAISVTRLVEEDLNGLL